MSVPTITRAPPVAQEGRLAKIGEKNTETKKARPVVIAVIPVFPPSTHWAESTYCAMKERLKRRRTSNTRCALDESRDGTGSQKRTHRDAERVNAVRDRAALKVHRDRVSQARELGHRV